MSEELQPVAPPPFQFGDFLDAFTLDEKFCYDNGVFKWLRANAGKKNRDWMSRVTAQDRSYLSYCISIRIKDPAVELQFRLMYSEDEVKLTRDNPKKVLTHIRKQ